MGLLVKNPNIDTTAHRYEPFLLAAKHNQQQILKILLDNCPVAQVPATEGEMMWCNASDNGHTDVVQILLNYPQLVHFPNVAFNHSCYYGFEEITKLLITKSSIGVKDLQDGLISAAFRGHTGPVKVLLQDPRLDPSFNNNEALNIAHKQAHPGVITVLTLDSRVYNAIDRYQAANNVKDFVLSPLNVFFG
jgi:ankyrin repeat protein